MQSSYLKGLQGLYSGLYWCFIWIHKNKDTPQTYLFDLMWHSLYCCFTPMQTSKDDLLPLDLLRTPSNNFQVRVCMRVYVNASLSLCQYWHPYSY